MRSPSNMSIEEIEEEIKSLEQKEQKGQDVHERIRVLLEELTKREKEQNLGGAKDEKTGIQVSNSSDHLILGHCILRSRNAPMGVFSLSELADYLCVTGKSRWAISGRRWDMRQ